MSTAEYSTFNKITTKSGFRFNENGQGVLSVEQVVFIQNVSSNLKNDDRYPKVLEDFVEGFSELIEDTTKFRSCLNPSVVDQSVSLAHDGTRDSLVRLLLWVLDIQSHLCRVLLEKTAEFSSDEATATADSHIPKLILLQFRWLDTLVDCLSFCNKLLEVFPILNVELQKEVISLVPEIIDDKNHIVIATAWIEHLKQNSELTLSLLHSLVNLNVPSECLDEMKSCSMDLIESVKVEDLPAVVKIVLHHVTAVDACRVLRETKKRLNSVFKSSSSSTSDYQNSKVLIMDAFETAVRFQKSTAEQLLKLLDAETDNFSCLDLLLLLMLLTTKTWERKAKLIIMSSMKKELLTKQIFEDAFTHNPQICIKYFKFILQIGEDLLKKNETFLRDFGGLIYKLLFSESNDEAVMQQVVMNLISHIRSENAVEIDEALEVLLHLTATTSKILPFGTYLKNLLDYMKTMNLHHVRKIYSILGQIASNKHHTVNRSLRDELHIIVRKQLSNPIQKFRLMGIIGAVNDLKILVVNVENESLTKDDCSAARDVIKMVTTQVEKDYFALSFFYDELTYLIDSVDNIDLEFRKWLTDRVTNSFQELYIVDANENALIAVQGVKGGLHFQLDVVDDAVSIAFNLLPISTNDCRNIDVSKRSLVSVVPSHFRLLQICSKSASSDGLEDINALLGCSVHFILESYLDRFSISSDKEKKFFVKCCFSLINYFIELVNAFSAVSEKATRFKVLQRLRLIVCYRKKLNEWIPSLSNFSPFVVRADVEETAVVVSAPVAEKKIKKNKVKAKPVKGKKRKRDDVDDHDDTIQTHTSIIESDEEVDDDQQSANLKKTNSSFNLNSYQVHFRELDLEVFHLLNNDLSLSQNLSQPNLTLSLNLALYLYEDFLSKLKALNESSVTPKRSFPGSKGKSVSLSVIHRNLLTNSKSILIVSFVGLLRCCRRHLDILCNHIGLTSAPSSYTPTPQIVENIDEAANLFLLIVKVIEEALDLSLSSKEMLSSALKHFNQKRNDPSNSQEDIFKEAKLYLLDIIEKSPGLTISVAVLCCLQKCKLYFNDLDLVKIAENILTSDWTQSDRQLLPMKNADIIQLIKIWLDAQQNPVSIIKDYISNTFPSALNGEEDAESSLINKNTLPVFCGAFYEKLITVLEVMHISKNKDKVDQDTKNRHYSVWSTSIRVFHSLVNLIKANDGVKMLSLSLKHSRRFLFLFIRFGLPILNSYFQNRKEAILELLKVLQESTRLLQHVCSHSKITKNMNLTNRVPLLKKELEKVVFQVKKLLASHNCSHAMFIGNLKNRNLKGEEILSQPTVVSDEEEEEVNESDSSTLDRNDDNEVNEDDDDGYRSECY